MSTELPKSYEHKDVEPRWYRFWMEKRYFRAEDQSDKPPYSIVLPPPNVTGSLHLGHALTATLQDVLIRYHRMDGYNTLWLPGTDHAGIATQMIVEKELAREGTSRHKLGREKFLERVWAWKEKYGQRISEQHKALGASLDWERERFTMDAGSSRAVREAFVRLYEENLIYRGQRLINWCPRCHTALSDLEVEHVVGAQGELWSFAYPLADGSGEIVVATTRPETMLGDTAVAVHPDDPRYKHLVGKNVRHPILWREFPIVADAELVDPSFGSGAVKVTPAHDFNDFQVGERHRLPRINILELDGRLNQNAGPFAGLDRFEARKKVKEAIAAEGLDRGTKPHVLALGRCQRCETVLEPMLSTQWFVKVGPLARAALEATDQGRIRFVPEQWKNTWDAWMKNLHDWCISRQLWWGHQIPAWYCDACGEVMVLREAPESCVACGGKVRQDEDVLDTWFSSGLWPFSTLGWPDQTQALRTFYPTTVMETGFDIIFFWVARMAMLGIHFMKDVPFRTVFLHAMVRDEKGEKMSKTRGNVIDPLDVTERYGADALRFTLAAMTAQGRDIKLSLDRVAGYRAFANKMWNAARFALMNLGDFDPHATAPSPDELSPADRWILARIDVAVAATRTALDEFRFNEAAATVYGFVWHELCDWYIEFAKLALQGGDPARRRAAQHTLVQALDVAMRLVHPFMPFVTEEIWQKLPKSAGAPESVMIAPFPRPAGAPRAWEEEMAPVIRAVDMLRSLRGEAHVPPGKKIRVRLASPDPGVRAALEKGRAAILQLAQAEEVMVGGPAPRPPQSMSAVEGSLEAVVPLAGLVDLEAEASRLQKQLEETTRELELLQKRLANPGFLAKAPLAVVEKDRARAAELGEKRRKLGEHLAVVRGPVAEHVPGGPAQPPAVPEPTRAPPPSAPPSERPVEPARAPAPPEEPAPPATPEPEEPAPGPEGKRGKKGGRNSGAATSSRARSGSGRPASQSAREPGAKATKPASRTAKRPAAKKATLKKGAPTKAAPKMGGPTKAAPNKAGPKNGARKAALRRAARTPARRR